jgi:hypothetical protein
MTAKRAWSYDVIDPASIAACLSLHARRWRRWQANGAIYRTRGGAGAAEERGWGICAAHERQYSFTRRPEADFLGVRAPQGPADSDASENVAGGDGARLQGLGFLASHHLDDGPHDPHDDDADDDHAPFDVELHVCSMSSGDGSGRASPPARLALRPSLSQVFQTEHEHEHGAVPTPPYSQTTFADRQQPHLLPAQDSPAYKSTATLGMHPDDENDDDLPRPAAVGGHVPTIRYPADVKAPPEPEHHGVPLPHSETRGSSVAGTDDEADGDDDDEDYDWSGDEDLLDEEARFEQRMSAGRRRGRRWGFRRILSLLFGSLIGSLVSAGVLATGPILLYFYWYKPHPSAHRRYVLDNVQAWLFWAAAQLIVSWVLALIVDIIPAVVTTTLSIVWGHVSEYIKTRIELYAAVKDNIKVGSPPGPLHPSRTD